METRYIARFWINTHPHVSMHLEIAYGEEDAEGVSWWLAHCPGIGRAKVYRTMQTGERPPEDADKVVSGT